MAGPAGMIILLCKAAINATKSRRIDLANSLGNNGGENNRPVKSRKVAYTYFS